VAPFQLPALWSPAIPVKLCSIATPRHAFPSGTCAMAFRTATTDKTRVLRSVVSTVGEFWNCDKMASEYLSKRAELQM
jgi:hypothetical protein